MDQWGRRVRVARINRTGTKDASHIRRARLYPHRYATTVSIFYFLWAWKPQLEGSSYVLYSTYYILVMSKTTTFTLVQRYLSFDKYEPCHIDIGCSSNANVQAHRTKLYGAWARPVLPLPRYCRGSYYLKLSIYYLGMIWCNSKYRKILRPCHPQDVLPVGYCHWSYSPLLAAV